MAEKHQQQVEIFSIESPCIGVCQANNKGYCQGCFRSRDERFYWNELNDADKRRVITQCALRKKRVLAAKRRTNSTKPLDTESANLQNNQSEFDF